MYINGTIVQMSGYQIIGTESYVATNSGTLAKFEISSGAIRRATASSGRKKEPLSGKKRSHKSKSKDRNQNHCPCGNEKFSKKLRRQIIKKDEKAWTAGYEDDISS